MSEKETGAIPPLTAPAPLTDELSEGRIIEIACAEIVNDFETQDVLDFARAIEREVAKAAPAAPVQTAPWLEGEPPHPWNQEWFIAHTIYGDRVVLKALPEEHTYDYQTADGTYMAARNIKRWMQFPDSEYVAPDAAPVQAEQAQAEPTPLDYRAQGREEALAIILAESAEDPFSDCIGWSNPVGPDDEGSNYWKEDKLRELLHIGDRKHDAYDRAEAAYWDALGTKEEAEREMRMVESAPFYKPLNDFLSKHQAWDLMADLKRAAPAVPAQAEQVEAVRAAEWISVEDRLPEAENEDTGRDVMVSDSLFIRGIAIDGGEAIGLGDYSPDAHVPEAGWRCYGGDYDFMHFAKVTHWMKPKRPAAPSTATSNDTSALGDTGGAK
jgi:hypothetical protein